jgi:hypothetical protein
VSLWGDTPVLGEEIYMAGYGRGGTGSSPGTSASGVLRAGMNILDSSAFSGAVNYIDFDSHLGTTQNIGSSAPLNLEALVNPGDSGGGWLKLDNEKLALTHITSGLWGNIDGRTDGGYNDLGIGISVSHYLPWIQEQALSLGAIQPGQSLQVVGKSIVPAMPKGLKMSAASDSSIGIEWTAVQGSTSYKVYRNGAFLATSTTRTYVDAGLLESWDYQYQVSAVNGSGESPLSPPVSVKTLTFEYANPLAVQVRTPSEDTEHTSTSITLTGRAGKNLTQGMSWSNRMTGTTGNFDKGNGQWQITVPLSTGTNVVDIRGFYNVGTPTNSALDTGSSAIYADGIQSGENGGFGFYPWKVSSSLQSEVIMRPSETNSTYRNFTLWSPSTMGASASLERKFPKLEASDKLKLKIRNKNLDPSGSAGVEILDDNGNKLLTVHSAPLGQPLKISDASGTRSISKTNAGNFVDLNFSFPSSGSYEVEVGGEKLAGNLNQSASPATTMRLFAERVTKTHEIIFRDSFDYEPSTSLLWRDGGTGFSGAWYGFGSSASSGTVTTSTQDGSKWVAIGTSPAVRHLYENVVTGTNPVYLSFRMMSPDFTLGNYCGIGLVSTSNVEDDRMFFGIPWTQDKFGFDARSGRFPLDVKTIDTLKPNQPYLVLVGLIPGSVQGKVDVKMWITENLSSDLGALVRSNPVISLTGADGKPNFTFNAVRISGDSPTALSIGDLTRATIVNSAEYEMSVAEIGIESNPPVWREVVASSPKIILAMNSSSDYDNDGIPDMWETQYFGSPSQSEATSDPDADGFTNLMEFRLGTNPLDAASYFGIKEFYPSENGIAMRWNSIPGKAYRVLAKESLNDGSWFDISGLIVAGSGVTEFIHLAAPVDGNLFYTIELAEDVQPSARPQSLAEPAILKNSGSHVSNPTEQESLTAPAEVPSIHSSGSGEPSEIPDAEGAEGTAPAPTPTPLPATPDTARFENSEGHLKLVNVEGSEVLSTRPQNTKTKSMRGGLDSQIPESPSHVIGHDFGQKWPFSGHNGSENSPRVVLDNDTRIKNKKNSPRGGVPAVISQGNDLEDDWVGGAIGKGSEPFIKDMSLPNFVSSDQKIIPQHAAVKLALPQPAKENRHRQAQIGQSGSRHSALTPVTSGDQGIGETDFPVKTDAVGTVNVPRPTMWQTIRAWFVGFRQWCESLLGLG